MRKGKVGPIHHTPMPQNVMDTVLGSKLCPLWNLQNAAQPSTPVSIESTAFTLISWFIPYENVTG